MLFVPRQDRIPADFCAFVIFALKGISAQLLESCRTRCSQRPDFCIAECNLCRVSLIVSEYTNRPGLIGCVFDTHYELLVDVERKVTTGSNDCNLIRTVQSRVNDAGRTLCQ